MKKKTYRPTAEQSREYNKRWLSKNAEFVKRREYVRTLREHWGMTPDDFDELSAAQGGVCAICGGTDKSKRLAIDHDHASGKIRGLLCGKCNISLGLLGDSVDILKSAIRYLKENGN